MSHQWKDIVVFFNHSDEGRFILGYAAQVAEIFNAHLTAIYVGHPVNRRPYNSYVVGVVATQEVLGKHKLEKQQLVDSIEEAFSEIVKGYKIKAECRTISDFISIEDITSQSFYCDLVILGSPETDILPAGLSAEQILLKTGAPTIIVPSHWQAKPSGKRIMIAWNASNVARRAVVDSLPILLQAESVRLLIVDNPGLEKNTGKEIVGYLSHHGIESDIEYVTSEELSVAQTIVNHAEAFNSDLIIIGAYSRSRFSEMFLGGVTKALLFNEVSLPLFISH